MDEKFTSKSKHNGVNIVVMFKDFILSLKRIKKLDIYIFMLYIIIYVIYNIFSLMKKKREKYIILSNLLKDFTVTNKYLV